MTGNSVVRNTNIVIDYPDEEPDTITVVSHLVHLFIPAVVAGELYVGIYRSTPVIKPAKAEKIERLIGTTTIWEIDNDGKNLCRNKNKFFRKGRPIPENNIWTAASAIQNNLPVYTTDVHFREVDGLLIFNPLSPV